MKYLVIALIWAGYCALHSYLISIRFTDLLKLLLKQYYAFYRLFYVLFSLALLIPLINYTEQLDNVPIINYGLYLNTTRQILTYCSLLMFFWSFFFDYDSASFFGIRQILSLWKAQKTDKSSGIKKNGILGIIRHPMYFALIVYLWCQTFSMANIVVNIVLTIYIYIGTRLEENKLVLEFGEAYIKYQQEVPMIVPFIKTKRQTV